MTRAAAGADQAQLPDESDSSELSDTTMTPQSKVMSTENEKTEATTAKAEPVLEQGEEEGAQKKIKKSRGKLFIFLGISIVAAAVIGGLWWMWAQGHEETDDSYVDGHITSVSSRISGTVTQVLVEDNQNVAVAQPLVRLDARDFQARVDKFLAARHSAEKHTSASKSKSDRVLCPHRVKLLKRKEASIALMQMSSAHERHCLQHRLRLDRRLRK